MIRRAIDKTGRPIVLSLSPGPTSLDHAAEVAQLANMWRISNDIWDVWAQPASPSRASSSDQFATTAAWAQLRQARQLARRRHAPPRRAPPLARRRQAPHHAPHPRRAADRAHPLGHGPQPAHPRRQPHPARRAHPRNCSPTETSSPSTRPPPPAARSCTAAASVAWTADLPDGSTALAFFNTGDAQQIINSSFEAFNVPTDIYKVHEVWTNKNLTKIKSVQSLVVEPHATVLWVLKK